MQLAKEFLAIILITTVIILLVRNASGTSTVLNALGSTTTSVISTLQGNTPGGLNTPGSGFLPGG